MKSNKFPTLSNTCAFLCIWLFFFFEVLWTKALWILSVIVARILAYAAVLCCFALPFVKAVFCLPCLFCFWCSGKLDRICTTCRQWSDGKFDVWVQAMILSGSVETLPILPLRLSVLFSFGFCFTSLLCCWLFSCETLLPSLDYGNDS